MPGHREIPGRHCGEVALDARAWAKASRSLHHDVEMPFEEDVHLATRATAAPGAILGERSAAALARLHNGEVEAYPLSRVTGRTRVARRRGRSRAPAAARVPDYSWAWICTGWPGSAAEPGTMTR